MLKMLALGVSECCKSCNQVGHRHKDDVCPTRGGQGTKSSFFMEVEDVDLQDWIETQSLDLAKAGIRLLAA